MTKSQRQLEAALEVYPEASAETQSILQKIFGKKSFLKNKKIEDLDFEEILELAKPSAEVLSIINYKGQDPDMKAARGFLSLTQVSKVYNEGKVIDWTNTSQYKYFMWAEMSTASGSGFSYSDYDIWDANSVCGSRLCFLDSDRAQLAMKKFGHFYSEMFNITNQKPCINQN